LRETFVAEIRVELHRLRRGDLVVNRELGARRKDRVHQAGVELHLAFDPELQRSTGDGERATLRAAHRANACGVYFVKAEKNARKLRRIQKYLTKEQLARIGVVEPADNGETLHARSGDSSIRHSFRTRIRGVEFAESCIPVGVKIRRAEVAAFVGVKFLQR